MVFCFFTFTDFYTFFKFYPKWNTVLDVFW